MRVREYLGIPYFVDDGPPRRVWGIDEKEDSVGKPIIYVSAPFQLQSEARMMRVELERAGYIVRARWLDEASTDPLTYADMARRDVEDIFNCGGLVLINPESWKDQGTGGRHVEVGLAFGAQLPVFIFGVRSNVFHHLPFVQCDVESYPQLVRELNYYFHGTV